MSPPSGAKYVEYAQFWRVCWFVRVVFGWFGAPRYCEQWVWCAVHLGFAILLGLQISCIVAPGSVGSSESTLPVFSFSFFFSPDIRSCHLVDLGYPFLPVCWSEVFDQFGGAFEDLGYAGSGG